MRVEGWERLLNAHVREASGQIFAWGSLDCALWCADWVRKATGQDLGADWRGRYTTELGAARVMKRRGLDGVEAIADRNLPRVDVPFARRGDIVLNDQMCLGICNGRQSHFLTAAGVTAIPTLTCVRAWKVG